MAERLHELRALIASLRNDLAAGPVTNAVATDGGARARQVAGTMKANGLEIAATFLEILASILQQAVANQDFARLALALMDDMEGATAALDAYTPKHDRALEGLKPKWELFRATEAEAPATSVPTKSATAGAFDYGQHGEMIDDFTAEGVELINTLEKDLMDLGGADTEMLHRIFRCAHTFKGMCGIVEVTPAYHLTHEMEALLEKVRDGKIAANADLENVLLECVDYLRRVVNLMTERENPLIDCSALATRVKTMAATGAMTGSALVGQTATKERAGAAADNTVAEQSADRQDVGSVAGARDGAGATETKKTGGAAAAQSFLRVETGKLNSVMEQVGEILVERIRLDTTRRQLIRILANFRKTREEREIDLPPEFQTLMESLEDFAGLFSGNVETINRVTGNLQESVMKMRLVPLSQVFSRFPRLVRDLSRKLGKQVELVIEGEETEIDKGVCEQLPEPLVHLIRNSIDHGLEDAATRFESGKDRTGRIFLKAFYEGDKVVIEIADDGRGLDEERITATAVKRGLLSPEEAAHLTSSQKLRLIFQPGFSTAETVTDVSGRGVGMDVVRATIENLSGVIDVSSEPGEGATVKLKLPLTMAILGILLLRLQKDTLALPLHNVRETLILPAEEIHESNNRQIINLRGEIVQLLSLADILGVTTSGQPDENVAIVIIEVADKVYGLVVDEFLGKNEIIIKNFGEILKKTPFVSGGAIMGNGRVVPILDPIEIVRDGGKHAMKTVTATPSLSEPSSGKRKRVLVVEDSATIARFLADLLRTNGYDVEIAGSGEEGLEMARKGDYDVVSTDIIMPGIDGYEFARQLRALPSYSIKPIVALSQKRESIDRIKGFQAGIDEYLTKPVQEEIYLGTILAMAMRG